MPRQKGRCLTVNNLPTLLDLTPVMAVITVIAGSAFSASAVLQFLRNTFLDNLTARMSDAARNDILRLVMLVINFVMILVAALFLHFVFSPQLLLSVFVAAVGATMGAHYQYGHNQKQPSGDPVYAEIPADAYPPLSPVPPTDSPASAALDPAA